MIRAWMSCGTVSGDLIYVYGVLGKKRVKENIWIHKCSKFDENYKPHKSKKFNKS